MEVVKYSSLFMDALGGAMAKSWLVFVQGEEFIVGLLS
jgi:hypothetical protein|tara:strand:- start:2137 stop:2250 length:114 start_codon:yes stop_codon:yes gene_type:complete